MNAPTPQTKLQHIRKSFQAAWDVLPAYRHMLPFFETLFTLQEAAVAATSPDPVPMTTEERAARLAGRLPLLNRSRLPYDRPAALTLLQTICREAEAATAQLAAGAQAVKTGLEERRAFIERGLDLFMTADLQGIHELSATLSMDETILRFLLYHSAWPSVARQVERVAASTPATEDWNQGFCPICGSPPSLGILNEIGARFLVCEFCRHQWSFKRLQCPSCGNEDSKSTSYFFSQDDPAYRVYTCDTCGKYLKTVDIRQLTRPFYAPLESIITAHLDLKARQMGYQGMNSETSA